MGFDLCFLPASPSTRQFKPCRILLPETIGFSVPVTIRPVEDDGDVPAFTPFSNIIVKYDGDDVSLSNIFIALNANHSWQGLDASPTPLFPRHHPRGWDVYCKHKRRSLSLCSNNRYGSAAGVAHSWNRTLIKGAASRQLGTVYCEDHTRQVLIAQRRVPLSGSQALDRRPFKTSCISRECIILLFLLISSLHVSYCRGM
jgi:hypothetical protein